MCGYRKNSDLKNKCYNPDYKSIVVGICCINIFQKTVHNNKNFKKGRKRDMSQKTRKSSAQYANFIISCLISLIAFVFITLFARSLSNIGSSATLESLFYYSSSTQTLTLFGESFPVSDFALKLFSLPHASLDFTLKIFPPMIRDFIYRFAQVFCSSAGDFVSFIIQFITR